MDFLKRSVLGMGATALALWSAPAYAQGYSVDIEFVRPTFGADSLPGVATPLVRKSLAFRYGIVSQYALNSVTLRNALENEELGAIVTNRGVFQLGGSVDLSERVTIDAMLPVAFNSGPGDSPEAQAFDVSGGGLGDFAVGGKVIAYQTKRKVFSFGPRGGLMIPSGRQEAFTGERLPRVYGSLLAALNPGPLLLAADVGVMYRSSFATTEDFVAGPETYLNVGARYKLPDATRLAFTWQGMTRAGLTQGRFITGAAENGVEMLTGVQVYPHKMATIDINAGRGLNAGYGTSDLRLLAAVTIQHAPEEPVPVIVEADPPPPPPPPPPIPEDPPVWEEGELAKVIENNIVIRDRLEFQVGTPTLLEVSRPTLKAVADIINAEGQIGHVVIEGHASIEGSFDYNYELSLNRAQTIFEELLKSGVHPSRVSFRSMGEVVPLTKGEDEASLQDNRRVEFHIVRQYGADEEWPEFPETARLPWNGESYDVIRPERPEPEKEPDQFEEFDEFEMDGPPPGEEGSDDGAPAGEPTNTAPAEPLE